MRNMASDNEDSEKYHRAMPNDVGTYYGSAAVEWLAGFHVDVPTAILNGLVWSPSREQLIFQLGDCWQARNFNLALGSGNAKRPRAKNFTSGDVNECLHIYNTTDPSVVAGVGGTLVVVEDPVSALRIGRLCPSMPLLGSHLAAARLNAVAGLFEEVLVWLDSDKLAEARSISRRFQLAGVKSRTIYTDLDPKCYTDEQIKEIIK